VKELGKTEGAATTAPVVRDESALISQARNQPNGTTRVKSRVIMGAMISDS
jgi:hypothetical protein